MDASVRSPAGGAAARTGTGPPRMPAFWKAVLVAPLAVPVALCIWIAASWQLHLRQADFYLAAGIVVVVGTVCGAIAMAVLGLPYLLWLRAKDRLSWLAVCAGSTLAGIGMAAPFWIQVSRQSALESALVGTGAGLLVGVVFCLVAGLPVWGRQVQGVASCE